MLTEDHEAILYHLGYEWWMFRSMYNFLMRLPDTDDPVRNALLESLVIHGRGLIDFFFCEAKKRDNKTDWVIDDLGHGLKHETVIPAELIDWRWHTNKRIAHITSSRNDPLTEWKVAEVRRLLEERILCVRNALKGDIPGDWPGDSPTTTNLIGIVGPTASAESRRDTIGATGCAGKTGPTMPTGLIGPTGPTR